MKKIGKVVNVENNKVYIVTKNNEFAILRRTKEPAIEGQLYSGEVYERNVSFKKIILIAFLFISLLLSFQLFNYYKTDMSIIVRMNVSVKINFNKWGRIIKVEGLNSSGRKILESVDIEHKPIKEGLILLTDECLKEGYINDTFKTGKEKITIFISKEYSNKNLDLSTFDTYIKSKSLNLLINNGGDGKIN